MNLRQKKRLRQEVKLAWADKRPPVKPPPKLEKINYIADKEKV